MISGARNEDLEKVSETARDLVKSSAELASDLILKTAKLQEVQEQFKLHETEDQRRFEIQERDHKLLFSKISQVIGDSNEKIKEDREVHKSFMDDLKDAKKDIGTLKVDVKEVKTDVSWIR